MIATMLLWTALGVGAQAPAAAGLPPPWEAKETLRQLRAKVTQMGLVLDQLPVRTWEGPGASNYVAVADSVRRQVAGIGGALDRLALEPQKLSAAIPLFVALQQVTGPLDSLSRGAAQFQGAEAARDLEEATNALLNEREKLVQYVLALVQFLENNVTVSQRELESCRQQLWKRASEPVRAPANRRR